ncbi:MAG: TIGR03790 family protein, partial [Sedimenticolaceae bacterium]
MRWACLLLFLTLPFAEATAGVLLLPKTALQPHEIALIINQTDPLSRAIGAYYRQRRAIPAANVIRVRFDARPHLAVDTFKQIYRQVLAQTPAHVQAYALAWARPYRVGCQTITTAFATGYDPHYCGDRLPKRPCSITGASAYFNSGSRRPYDDHGLRPSMLLAAATIEEAKRLIDRGIAADGTFPTGTAYLLSTSDKARTVRDRGFARIEAVLGERIAIEVYAQDHLQGKDDVLFYFTGRIRVDYLDSLRFLPGAVGDHLTSAGGKMARKGVGKQMSALRWLEAG